MKSGQQVDRVATQPLPPRGLPNASERGRQPEVGNKWAGWLHNPCHLRGSPKLNYGENNKKWPTSVLGGYIAPAGWGVAEASERGKH